jgi:hypothetical protein
MSSIFDIGLMKQDGSWGNVTICLHHLIGWFEDMTEGENTPLKDQLRLHTYLTIFIIMKLFCEAGIAQLV